MGNKYKKYCANGPHNGGPERLFLCLSLLMAAWTQAARWSGIPLHGNALAVCARAWRASGVLVSTSVSVDDGDAGVETEHGIESALTPVLEEERQQAA